MAIPARARLPGSLAEQGHRRDGALCFVSRQAVHGARFALLVEQIVSRSTMPSAPACVRLRSVTPTPVPSSLKPRFQVLPSARAEFGI